MNRTQKKKRARLTQICVLRNIKKRKTIGDEGKNRWEKLFLTRSEICSKIKVEDTHKTLLAYTKKVSNSISMRGRIELQYLIFGEFVR